MELDIKTIVTIAIVWAAMSMTVISDFIAEKDPDRTWGEMLFWVIASPFAVGLMFRHDLKDLPEEN